MSGEKWNEFLESIKTRGVIEPIVITQDKVIVSGHQRVRACKELGITKIACDVHHYDSEDEILQDLLETNIRQRGDVGGSAKKVGLRIKELERIYGIKEGRPEKLPNNSVVKSQSDIATQMGISVDTLRNYKTLADMIPELSDLVDTGVVTKTTALALMKELPEKEQIELISSLPSGQKYTQKQIKEKVDEIKKKADENMKEVKKKISELEKTNKDLLAQPVQVVRDELADRTIEDLKRQLADKDKQLKELDAGKDDYALVASGMDKIEIERAACKTTTYQLVSHASEIFLKMDAFIKEMAAYDYLSQSFNEIPTATRLEYKKYIEAIKKWADNILDTINRTEDIIDAE
nr:MAG TPA: chromosome partitioning protein [Caudoviricetes sp.]